MPYFSNKPAPTTGPLLPSGGQLPTVVKEPDLRPSLKRKLDVDGGKKKIFRLELA